MQRTVLAAMLAAAIFGWFASSGCGPEPFDSKDAGLYQSSPVGQDGWYHVATLHGWADNFEVCREIVEFLEETGNRTYMCQGIE